MKSKSTTTHEVEWAICHERQGESFARRLSYTEGLDVVDLVGEVNVDEGPTRGCEKKWKKLAEIPLDAEVVAFFNRVASMKGIDGKR